MRDDHLITVRPVPGGWRVALDDFQPQLFLSGGQAERHARDLAARLSEIGDDARVLIHDRTTALVSTRHYFAE